MRWVAARALEARPATDASALAANDSRPAVRAEALLVTARRMLADGRTDGDSSSSRLGQITEALLPLLQPAVEMPTRLVAVRALEVVLLAGAPERCWARDSLPIRSWDRRCCRSSVRLATPRPRTRRAARSHRAARRAGRAARRARRGALRRGADLLLYALSALRGDATAGDARAALQHLAPLRSRPGGNSYQGYLDAIERRLVAQAPEAERDALRVLAQPAPVAAIDVVRDAPPRDADRTLAYVNATLDAPERSAAEGAFVFAHTCAACHRRGEFAGRGGPDLSSVGSRLQTADLLTAILQPSRDISDQYRSTRLC